MRSLTSSFLCLQVINCNSSKLFKMAFPSRVDSKTLRIVYKTKSKSKTDITFCKNSAFCSYFKYTVIVISSQLQQNCVVIWISSYKSKMRGKAAWSRLADVLQSLTVVQSPSLMILQYSDSLQTLVGCGDWQARTSQLWTRLDVYIHSHAAYHYHVHQFNQLQNCDI